MKYMARQAAIMITFLIEVALERMEKLFSGKMVLAYLLIATTVMLAVHVQRECNGEGMVA